MSIEQQIFKRGSTTYYFSSKFFPSDVRREVYKLYSFVRVADDYVDQEPPQADAFKTLVKDWRAASKDPQYKVAASPHDKTPTRVIKNMVSLQRTYSLEQQWVEDFLRSMKSDINPKPFQTLDQTLDYIHGSAEVIGLMVSSILGLPPSAQESAIMQGRAMQMINFIRDIKEDNQLGRCYFPVTELEHFGLPDLSETAAQSHRREFTDFIRFQIDRYRQWQAQAAKDYKTIPYRYRVPIRTAADMYSWTADQIYQDPFVVFDRTVKPHRMRVVHTAFKRSVRA